MLKSGGRRSAVGGRRSAVGGGWATLAGGRAHNAAIGRAPAIERASRRAAATLDRSLASAAHLGRTTQLWDAVVTHRESGKTLALFRCTQLVLYPKS